jgi:allantoin racemase
MTLRVYVQNIWPRPEEDLLIGAGMSVVYEQSERLIRSALGGDAEVRFGFNPRTPYLTSCASFEAVNNVGLLAGLLEAEAQGFDVAVISCGNDPALRAARTALSIPVVSLTESGMLLACVLGRKFGVITMDDSSVPLVEENLAFHGLRDRAISHRPVRSGGFYEPMIQWFSDPDYLRSHVVPRFEAVARGLVEDGAEVIVTACGAYACLPLNGYVKVSDTDAPILDATLSAAFMAGAMGGLNAKFGISTSKQRSFKNLPQEMCGHFLAPLLR